MHRVVRSGTGYSISFADGRDVPVMMAGRPAVLSPGWVPVGAVETLDPLVILVLAHANGAEAAWFLDREGNFLAGSVGDLPTQIAETLTQSVRTAWSDILRRFLTDAAFPDGDAEDDFFAVKPFLSGLISGPASSEGVPGFRCFDARSVPENGIGTRDGAVPLRRDAVLALLATSPEETYLAACRSGSVVWPSPVDGLPVEHARGMVLAHLLLAWRCVDRRNNLVFFVLTRGFGEQSVSLLLPDSIFPDEAGAVDGNRNAAGDINTINAHVLLHGRQLLGFLRKPVAGIAHFMWGEHALHVGHFHWNELSGLETILTRLTRADYPIIYDMAGAARSNFYDRLSYLFPEFGGSVDLSCPSFETMSRHAYGRGIQIVRFGGSYVSAMVRERIAMAIGITKAAGEAAQVRGSSTAPVIVLGLRVENRSLTDPVGFYATLVKAVVARHGSATIVVDGHNGMADRKGDSYNSYLENRAATRPIDIERHIVADLRESLRRYDVRIIDCIGMTLRDNLAWMSIADYCVAPWGAGLAKYRWALNLPCYVLVSNYCFRHKGDINIYTDGDNMERPTTLEFSPEDLVTDRPDLAVLVPMDPIYEPYYVNYDLDTAGVVTAILDRIDRIVPPPGGQG